MNAVLHHSKATGRAKLVLLGIANHHGEHGAWPSIETLARYANASTRSVKRDIADLVALGELNVEINASPQGRQYRTNLYRITIESGVTDWVSRGDSSGKSGVTVGGTQNITRNIKKQENKATKIPDDFWPDEDLIEWHQKHFPQVDLKLETHKMKDWFASASGRIAVKSDWRAAWRNWIRNSAGRAPKRLSRAQQDEMNRQAVREMIERESTGD